jgi:hypothetical protein
MLACAVLMTVSCQSKSKKNTPEAVTEQFAKAFFTGDFTHQYQYTTKKSDVLIKQLQTAMKDDTEQLEKMKNKEVQFVSTSVDSQTDSTATCTCKALVDGEPRETTWDLIKEDGEWKVSLVMP